MRRFRELHAIVLHNLPQLKLVNAAGTVLNGGFYIGKTVFLRVF
jgi:hypothetical protein